MAQSPTEDEHAQMQQEEQQRRAELRKRLTIRFGYDIGSTYLRYIESRGLPTSSTNRKRLCSTLVSSLAREPHNVIELFVTLFEEQEARIKSLEFAIQSKDATI